jgi:hypothetical protein
MSYFDLLSNDILREIFMRTETLSDLANIRRTCKKFYQAMKVYGKDLFEVRYHNELGIFGIKSDNMICYMSQGFYYNFFPAVRHALRNGVHLDHRYIQIENDASGRLYNLQYIDHRLSLWKMIFKNLKIEHEHVNFIIYYAWKSLIVRREGLDATADDKKDFLTNNRKLYCSFYLSLMELLIEHNIKIKQVDEKYKNCSGYRSKNDQNSISKFYSLLDRIIES